MVDAKKNTMSAKQALALAKQVDEIIATKGKQVVHLDLRKEKPDPGTLKSLLIGPSGNLRAPTLRIGRTLVVGFDEEAYRSLLG
jgi:arsenate reductase-like glutaredoxin family protein